jgi:hypothetical protein
MQPPPPDILVQQPGIHALSTPPSDDPSTPQRKRPRSGSSTSEQFITIYNYDPANPIFSAPGAILLGELANMVNIFSEDNPTSLDARVWLSICNGIAAAVARSIERMDFSDDAGSTWAVWEGLKIFSNLARHFDMPEDAAMEQDKEPEPILYLPNPFNLTNNTILTLREIQANNKSINDRMFRLENRITNVMKQQDERKAKTSMASNPAVNTTQTTSSPKNARLLYATVTGNGNKTPNSQPNPPASSSQGRKDNVANAPQRPQPIWYIICYLGHLPSQEQRLLPKIISNRINTKLSLIPLVKGLSILGSHWNASGNCVLTFPPQTSSKLIEDHFPAIRNAMGLNEDQVISRDTLWSKVRLRAVYAQDAPSSSVYSNSNLMASLMANPVMSKIKITQPPCWVRRLEDIDGFKSLISFAFEDPNSQLVKLILKTQLFMFGSPVQAKRWEDKPQLRQCPRCWKLGHFEVTCRAPVRCRHCGDKHPKLAHHEHCRECTNTKASVPCNHPPKCTNCCKAHTADSPECPERRKYSIPLSARNIPTKHPDADCITKNYLTFFGPKHQSKHLAKYLRYFARYLSSKYLR